MNEKDTLNKVKTNSMKASDEAFKVLEALKSREISIKEASEMSNALGKVNAANGNALKADILSLELDKQKREPKNEGETSQG